MELNHATIKPLNPLTASIHLSNQSMPLRKTASAGIKTGAHIIFGLPDETREQMLKEADILSTLPINNIKFHQLQIVKNTPIEKAFKIKPERFELFELDEYIEFIIKFIERLNPEFIIERFTGEMPPRFISGPNWGLIRNDQVNRLIEKKLEEKNTWQGRKFNQELKIKKYN